MRIGWQPAMNSRSTQLLKGLKRLYRSALHCWAEMMTKASPLVIVPLSGGLGNQIWQYAVGMGAQLASGLPVKFGMDWYKKFGLDIQGKEKRDFELLQTFPTLWMELADANEEAFFRRYYYYEPKYFSVFDSVVYNSLKARYIGGFCANSQYLSVLPAEFWNQFSFADDVVRRNEALVRRINDPASTAVHVRGGDYIGSMHDVITINYYRKAMDILQKSLGRQDVKFYIFSNDPVLCRNFFPEPGENIHFLCDDTGRSPADDLYLMTQCRHHIIANSTLSWLGAWLCANPAKRVIMPGTWFNEKAPSYIRRGSETAFRVDGWITLAVD